MDRRSHRDSKTPSCCVAACHGLLALGDAGYRPTRADRPPDPRTSGKAPAGPGGCDKARGLADRQEVAAGRPPFRDQAITATTATTETATATHVTSGRCAKPAKK